MNEEPRTANGSSGGLPPTPVAFASIRAIGPGAIARVLILNLDRQPYRWTRMTDQLRLIGIESGGTLLDVSERVPAVDGLNTALSGISGDVARSYTLADFFAVDPQTILKGLANREGIVISSSPQELAVAQSHLEIWRRVAEGEGHVLVLEDDAEFVPHFGPTVDRAWAELETGAPDGFDLVYLSYRPVDSGLQCERWSPMLVRPRSGLWWLSGYILSARGARRLLEALPIVGPVDQWLNHQLSELEAYAIERPVVGQARHAKSDNEYSIIPILRTARGTLGSVASQAAGDLPLTTGALPERRAPVFGIGLSKTGTTSLHEALARLGYLSCHWQSDEFSDHVSNLIDSGEPLPFDAFTDVASVVRRFRDLDVRYPDAAFVLTTRRLEDWLRSRARHVVLNQADVANGRAVHSWTSIDIEGWKSERLIHHEAVFSYFHDRPNKLLVLDICGGDEWEPLCSFLGLPVPPEPFPRVDPLATRHGLRSSRAAQRLIAPGEAAELPHDDLPWIDRPSLRPCPPSAGTAEAVAAAIGGEFLPIIDYRMDRFDPRVWTKLTDTFDTNLALFRPENVIVTDSDGLRLEVRSQRVTDRAFTAGGIATAEDPARWFRYGRFEGEIRPAACDGVLTGLFLYRRDPWQEIDLEFLGRDPTKLLANIYYNPGLEGDLYNYGSRGTPVLIDLGFDASQELHSYAIEWDPSGVRWLVDDVVVYARAQHPTAVPDLPLRLYTTTWPINAAELAGTVPLADLPAATHVRSLRVATWVPPVT